MAVFSKGGPATIGGAGPLGRFMFQPLTTGKLIWIPIGVIAVVGVSYAVTFWDFQFAPFVGIFFSGIIMFIAFLQTNSLLTPIIIHGIYNSIVTYLAQGSNAIFNGFTPDVGFSGVNLSETTRFLFEIALQNTLVAPSEEMFKLFGLAIFIAILKGNYARPGLRVFMAVIIITLIWTVLHLIQGS